MFGKPIFLQCMVGALWLSMGAGCQKAPPEPDYTCGPGCCIDNDEVFFVKKLEGEPMDKTGSIFMTLESLGLTEAVAICATEPVDEIFKSSLVTYTIRFPLETSPRPPYRFRLWGLLYKDRGIGVTGTPMHWVKVERVERVN